MVYKYDDNTLQQLRIIESTRDSRQRSLAIQDLSKGGKDQSRLMIDLYNLTMWRETKFELIKAIGGYRNMRVLEFLFKLVENNEDLPIAKRALIALGQSHSIVAAEYLLGVLEKPDHPLKREAVMALTGNHSFPCASVFAQLLLDGAPNLSQPLQESLLLALGRRGQVVHRPIIEGFFGKVETSSSLLHAAIIGAGNLGNHQTLQTLESLDTRFHFFSDQLKRLAIDKVEAKIGRSIEDAIQQILSNYGSELEWDHLNQLREFPCQEAWEAYQILSEDIDLEREVKVRFFLSTEERREDDLEFLRNHYRSISLPLMAGLIRSYDFSTGREHLSDLLPSFDVTTALELYGCVKCTKIPAVLADTFTGEAKEDHQILAINSLVQQCMMHRSSVQQKIVVDSEKILLKIINGGFSVGVQSRALRALGQIGSRSQGFFSSLAKKLKDKAGERASIYAAVATGEMGEGVELVASRLKSLINSDSHRDEIGEALRSLSKYQQLPKNDKLLDVIGKLKVSCHQENQLSLLKILSFFGIEGFEDLIQSGLESQDYQTKMLAIAASKYNQSPTVTDTLLSMLEETNRSFLFRVLDSLSVGAPAAAQRRLFDWLLDEDRDEAITLKVLRSLNLRSLKSYRQIQPLVEEIITRARRDGSLKLVEAGLNLHDNFQTNIILNDAQKQISGDKAHKLDVQLESELSGFSSLSEIVKSVLRSGELAYTSFDIKDTKVDKSAFAIAYTKSIDLILKEHLGSQIFAGNDDILTKMQSRIIQLQLDDRKISASSFIRDLQCSDSFNHETYPHHKIMGLCESILNGKIMRIQYRGIDGLRAWGILLLIFGRTFSYRGLEIKPVFRMKNTKCKKINSIASSLNSLQDVRNRAAHLGVFVDPKLLEELRKMSFELMENLINQVLH